MTQQIEPLKRQFRKAVLAYRGAINETLDCGLHMQAVIRPGVGAAAKRANDLAEQLKAIDPDFPLSWTPYPTG